jgi:hypothetical protein
MPYVSTFQAFRPGAKATGVADAMIGAEKTVSEGKGKRLISQA